MTTDDIITNLEVGDYVESLLSGNIYQVTNLISSVWVRDGFYGRMIHGPYRDNEQQCYWLKHLGFNKIKPEDVMFKILERS